MVQVKVIHDVTACIYKINCARPVFKWSFQTKLEEQQKDKLDTFPVYVVMPVNEYYKIYRSK